MIIFNRNSLEVSTLAAARRLLHGITEARALILLLEFSVNLLHEHGPLRRLARSLASTTTRYLTSGHLFLPKPPKIYAPVSDPGS